jgi:hypothetical protein
LRDASRSVGRLGNAARAAINEMVERDVLLRRMQIRNAEIDDLVGAVAHAESETRNIVQEDGPRDMWALQEHFDTVVTMCSQCGICSKRRKVL